MSRGTSSASGACPLWVGGGRASVVGLGFFELRAALGVVKPEVGLGCLLPYPVVNAWAFDAYPLSGVDFGGRG